MSLRPRPTETPATGTLSQQRDEYDVVEQDVQSLRDVQAQLNTEIKNRDRRQAQQDFEQLLQEEDIADKEDFSKFLQELFAQPKTATHSPSSDVPSVSPDIQALRNLRDRWRTEEELHKRAAENKPEIEAFLDQTPSFTTREHATFLLAGISYIKQCREMLPEMQAHIPELKKQFLEIVPRYASLWLKRMAPGREALLQQMKATRGDGELGQRLLSGAEHVALDPEIELQREVEEDIVDLGKMLNEDRVDLPALQRSLAVCQEVIRNDKNAPEAVWAKFLTQETPFVSKEDAKPFSFKLFNPWLEIVLNNMDQVVPQNDKDAEARRNEYLFRFSTQPAILFEQDLTKLSLVLYFGQVDMNALKMALLAREKHPGGALNVTELEEVTPQLEQWWIEIRHHVPELVPLVQRVLHQEAAPSLEQIALVAFHLRLGMDGYSPYFLPDHSQETEKEQT